MCCVVSSEVEVDGDEGTMQIEVMGAEWARVLEVSVLE